MKYIFLFLLMFLLSCSDRTTVNHDAEKNTDASLTQTDSLIDISKPTPKYRNSEIIETIYFVHGSSTIKLADIKRLKQLADICASDSLSYLKVFGFTDTLGTEKENDKLAEKRALAVYNYLDPNDTLGTNCVYVDWLGESIDIYDLHFPQAHAQQNSVDIWIMTRRQLK
jgi:outer membrane protein OmpA-like peptidoglycan-associated protein